MIAMEGKKIFRFEPEYYKYEEIIDHKNVIYIELSKRYTAFEFSQIINEFGDIYVVKDSINSFFIEF